MKFRFRYNEPIPTERKPAPHGRDEIVTQSVPTHPIRRSPDVPKTRKTDVWTPFILAMRFICVFLQTFAPRYRWRLGEQKREFEPRKKSNGDKSFGSRGRTLLKIWRMMSSVLKTRLTESVSSTYMNFSTLVWPIVHFYTSNKQLFIWTIPKTHDFVFIRVISSSALCGSKR